MKTMIARALAPLGFDANQASGFLDFLIGFLLITMPWFYVQDTDVVLLTGTMIVGSVLILYSIFTDYKRGIVKFILKKIQEAIDLTVSITAMALWSVKFTVAGLLLLLVSVILMGSVHIL